MGLRDPIWQGIAAIIAILTFVGAVIAKIFPGVRVALRKLYSTITESATCLIMILVVASIFLCWLVFSPAKNLVSAMLATPTPTSTSTPVPSPTSTPTPPPNYTYLLYDNFDNGVSAAWQPVAGNWQMINGQYTMTNVGDNWTSGTTFAGIPNMSDYVVGVDVNLPVTFADINNQAEIIVRAQDQQNYLAVVINNSALLDLGEAKGTWGIVSNGQWSPMPSASFSTGQYSNPMHIEIMVQGNIVTTFINHEKVNYWSGAPFLTGYVGLGIASYNPTDPAAFDNFFVRLIYPQ